MTTATSVVVVTMTPSSNGNSRSGTSGDVWEKAARGGYAVTGLVHLVLGYLIVRLAFPGGGESGETDSSSALASLQDAPVGSVVLWVAVLAWAALAAWCALDAVRSGLPGKDRARDAGKAIVYAALAFSAWSIATGSSGSSSDSQAQGVAGSLMSAPAGRVLVAAIGLAIVGAGAFFVFKGVTRKFEEDLRRAPDPVKTVGLVGYPAKGVALAVVGVLFVYAAFTADSSKAQGLDGAIDSLLDAPGGTVIVVVVGLGFAAYGLYSFGRARYGKM